MKQLGVIVCLLVVAAHAWYMPYLPGVAPTTYKQAQEVPLKVNKMTSNKRQFPLPFYSLNFCKPSIIENVAENLGELLAGDLIQNSAFRVMAGVPVPCEVLCTHNLTKTEIELFIKRIKEEYKINWMIDNLPAATPVQHFDKRTGKNIKGVTVGFPLGEVDGGNIFLNNHYKMTIKFHTEDENEGKMIVGFEVEPSSIEYGAIKSDDRGTCDGVYPRQQLNGLNEGASVTWSYSIEWKFDDRRWASRWDIYLEMTDTHIHWFSITNSLMIVLFLSGMVGMIMMRTIMNDFARYSEEEKEEQEETGWKLVHGDVFRPPKYPLLLSVSIGTGIQIFTMSILTLFFALLGFLSPAQRGSLITVMLITGHLMAVLSGYFSARVYKIFKGEDFKKLTLMTAFFYPAIAFALFFILNLELKIEKSSAYVDFKHLCSLLAMWLGISVPLTCFGSYLGFKKPAPENPVRTNQIPRQIPPQVWYMKAPITIMMGGILPFGAIFIELFFILSSIWQHQFYYMFGFLFIVFIILVLTCSEICIVLAYFQLCSEDYNWCWRSFLTAAASAFYIFLYSVYYATKLHVDGIAPLLLYFGYTAMIAGTFALLTGAVGWFAVNAFIRAIYSNIHVD